MRGWPVVLVLVLLTGSTAAQSPPVFELPEVIVPGRRPQARAATPASISVITRRELDRLGARTVADALRLVPELVVRTYAGPGGLSEASIRGFGPGQVLVLLDGVPVTNVALGQADLSTLSTVGVARIEVLRGPFGAIAGSGAVGGVINIITEDAPAVVQVRAGGAGERTLRVGGSSGGWSLSLEAGAGRGHRPNSDHAGGTLLVRWTPSPPVHLSLHYYTADLGTPGDLALPTPTDRQAIRRVVAQARWDGGSSGQGRVFAVAEHLAFYSPFGVSTYASSTMGAEAQRAWTVAPGRLVVAGWEVARAALQAEVFGSPIARETTAGAVTLQYDATWSSRLLASLGLRLDVHSAYGATLNPRLGIVYTPDERTRVRAAVGRTFRGPTFLQLYFPGCSDPSLRPETAWSAELGVERDTGTLLAGATVFAAEARDLISGGCPPQNIGAASIRGASVELRAALHDRLTGAVHLTVQRAIDRATGDVLPRVPSLTAGATLAFEPRPGVSFVASALYVGPRTDLDFSVFPAAAVPLPGYTDVLLRYQRVLESGWTVTVEVDNLLDVPYEAVKGYPAPGRSLFVTASRRY